MIPIMQTKVVVKNSNGDFVVRGNCFAACVASIIELPIQEVPNVEVFFHVEGSYWAEVMLTFLQSKGWDLSTDNRFRAFHTVFTDETYTDLNNMQMYVKDKYYLVSGKSIRGVNHICIYQNGNLIHDPYPTKEGLITFENFQTLEKI